MAEAARRHIRGAVAEGAPRDQGAAAEADAIGEHGCDRGAAHAIGEKLHRAPDC